MLETAGIYGITGCGRLATITNPGAYPASFRCVDCGAVIPFDRLQLQPQALRCTDCQAAQEAAA